MGRSGSGKGTQSALLKADLEKTGQKVFYFEAGERFRQFAAKGSYSGLLMSKVMNEGLLLPSFLPVWNWANSFIENLTGEECLIMDGGLRLLNEAKMFNEALQFYNRIPAAFIYINTHPEEATKRLALRGRSDDASTEKIASRMKWFEEEVLPVIEYYRTLPSVKFIEIDGIGTIEEVADRIKSALADYLND